MAWLQNEWLREASFKDTPVLDFIQIRVESMRLTIEIGASHRLAAA